MGSRKGKRDLTAEERRQIFSLSFAGTSAREIAAVLGRHHSTIRKELYRGRCQDMASCVVAGVKVELKYEWYAAQCAADAARKNKGRRALFAPEDDVVEKLAHYIKQNYSPYAALQMLRDCGYVCPCVQTVYSYMHSGFYSISEADMLRPPKRKKHKPLEPTREAKNRKSGHSIDIRPVSVGARSEFGHWEGDLVLSPHKSAKGGVLTLVERKCRAAIVVPVANKTQDEIKQKLDWLENIFGSAFYRLFKSITFDNGIEFVDYDNLTRSAMSNVPRKRFEAYYAHPYRSGERGSNENFNGFLRRYFPKGTIFSDVPEKELFERVAFINNYPRKLHGGKSASLVFREQCLALGIDTNVFACLPWSIAA